MYMKNSTRLYYLLVLVVSLAAFIGCRKEDESPAYPNKGYLVFTGDAGSKLSLYGPALSGQVGVVTRNIFNLATSATRPTTDSITGVIWMYSKLTDAELADLKAGKWYYTISTANIAGGEVRGQISYQRSF